MFQNGRQWSSACIHSRFGLQVLAGRVTNRTTLADLSQILIEEWDAIPQQNVAKLVTSMRRRCQAVVAAYGSSTRY